MSRQHSPVSAFPAPDWFEALRQEAAADAELAVIGRWCTLDFVLMVGNETILLRLEGGKIADVVYEPDIGASWSVTLRGTLRDWLTFLQPTPPPFYSSLLAMNSRVPLFSIEGDRKLFVRHLRPLDRIFRLAQQLGGGRG